GGAWRAYLVVWRTNCREHVTQVDEGVAPGYNLIAIYGSGELQASPHLASCWTPGGREAADYASSEAGDSPVAESADPRLENQRTGVWHPRKNGKNRVKELQRDGLSGVEDARHEPAGRPGAFQVRVV